MSTARFVVAQSATTNKKFDADHLADMIIVGLVSEDQFQDLNLTLTQKVKVFKHIRTKRGWTMTDSDLEQGLSSPRLESKKPDPIQPAYSGSCGQKIEQESGSSFAAYPVGQTSPNSGECGTDSDDIVLLYNTPNAPNTNADNVRWYSTLWWVRSWLGSCYSSGLGANGLCSTTTRVCMGSCGKALGSDLNYVYLWQK